MTLPHRLLALATIFPILALLALTSGCANPVLYNQARDKQGQEAKAAIAEVNLVTSVDTLQAKFKSLNALEMETLKARSTMSRNLALVELTKPPNQYRDQVTVQDRYVTYLLDTRLDALGGTGPDKVVVDEYHRQSASKLRVLSVVAGTKIDSCDAATALDNSATKFSTFSALEKTKATMVLSDAVKFCKRVAAETAAKNSPGIVNDLRLALEKDEKTIAAQKRRVREYAVGLKSAMEASAQEPLGETSAEKLQSAASKLEATLAKWEAEVSGIDAKALKEAQASMRYEALNKLLKVFSSGTTELDKLSPDERRAVLVVRAIPSLADEVKAWNYERTRIRLAPLVLAKESQRLALEGFKGELVAMERKAKIRARMLESAQSERMALVNAKKSAGSDPAMLSAPLGTMLDSGTPAQRYQLYTSLTYFDLAEEHRMRTDMAQMELEWADTDIAIVKSQSAAKQWQALATSIAAVLGDFHGQGVKPGDVAEFLKAFGIIGIAAK